MLKLQNISKTFYAGTVNEKQAICSLNLQVNDGDFVTVIGSNGAGKSTLFQLIAGTLFPDSGKIFMDGKDITFVPEYRRAKQIGRIFQDPMKGTAPSMTVEENMALAYAGERKSIFSLGIGKKERELFREKLASLHLGLEDRMKSPIGLLSGGQRQAISLLMATMSVPKLLLLDEHTAALDPKTAQQVLNLTKETVKSNRISTLMITHDIKTALSVGNRTIMMDDGEIIMDLQGEEREKMTVSALLDLFQKKGKEGTLSDRMLLQ